MDCSPLGACVHGNTRRAPWSGEPPPPPGVLPDPAIEPASPLDRLVLYRRATCEAPLVRAGERKAAQRPSVQAHSGRRRGTRSPPRLGPAKPAALAPEPQTPGRGSADLAARPAPHPPARTTPQALAAIVAPAGTQRHRDEVPTRRRRRRVHDGRGGPKGLALRRRQEAQLRAGLKDQPV